MKLGPLGQPLLSSITQTPQQATEIRCVEAVFWHPAVTRGPSLDT